VISLSSSSSLLNYLTAQTSQNAGSAGNGTASATGSTNANTKVATVTQASLQAAAGRHDASVTGRALDKQQTALAGDLRAAMNKAGIKLSGSVEFSVSSNGTVSTKGSDADKAAMTAFLKADTSKPGFAARIATQAQDALKLSATIQQTAAISQAARYGGKSGVMSMYASLMQQTNTTAAVFTVAAGSSSLTYPGALAAKA
jgi:hypothetical protein